MLNPDNMPVKFNRRARVRARRNTVQALYEWFMTNKDVKDILTEFEDYDNENKEIDFAYFKELLKGSVKHSKELDEYVTPLIDRDLDKLDKIERSLLLIGCYELKYNQEIPWRVVVNESVELAKVFGAEDSYKYINGVLDKLARELRATEIEKLD